MGNITKKGDIVEATITSIKDFGAFADYGKGSGLIYYTQIVPEVEYGNISNVLSINQQVKCKVIEIKPDGKISLTMKLSASKEKKPSRYQIIENVKEDIKDMSSNDTTIRAIWKALTEIQHYMLKYMQGNIPLKKGSTKIDSAGNKLTAEIDTSVHFDSFKKEVRRIFDADVIKHEYLKNYWYFNSDVELHSQSERTSFAESSGHMYVVVHPDPVLEVLISISDNNTKDKEVIVERLLNYYPQMEILSERDNTLYVTFPYRNKSELKDLIQELGYAMSGIQNGVQDDEDDEDNDTQNENKRYDAINFNYELKTVNDSCDRFLVTLNPEALMDQEGLRFGSFPLGNYVFFISD